MKHVFDYCEEYLLSLTSALYDFLPNILCQVFVVAWLVSKKMHLWPVHGLYYDIIRLSSPIKAMNLPENVNYVVHNV